MADQGSDTGQRIERGPLCESCGAGADVKLDDGSTWCDECDRAARKDEHSDEPAVGQQSGAPRRRSPLADDSVLSGFGKACHVSDIAFEVAKRHVGVAVAHRLAADLFDEINPSGGESHG